MNNISWARDHGSLSLDLGGISHDWLRKLPHSATGNAISLSTSSSIAVNIIYMISTGSLFIICKRTIPWQSNSEHFFFTIIYISPGKTPRNRTKTLYLVFGHQWAMKKHHSDNPRPSNALLFTVSTKPTNMVRFSFHSESYFTGKIH